MAKLAENRKASWPVCCCFGVSLALPGSPFQRKAQVSVRTGLIAPNFNFHRIEWVGESEHCTPHSADNVQGTCKMIVKLLEWQKGTIRWCTPPKHWKFGINSVANCPKISLFFTTERQLKQMDTSSFQTVWSLMALTLQKRSWPGGMPEGQTAYVPRKWGLLQVLAMYPMKRTRTVFTMSFMDCINPAWVADKPNLQIVKGTLLLSSTKAQAGSEFGQEFHLAFNNVSPKVLILIVCPKAHSSFFWTKLAKPSGRFCLPVFWRCTKLKFQRNTSKLRWQAAKFVLVLLPMYFHEQRTLSGKGENQKIHIYKHFLTSFPGFFGWCLTVPWPPSSRNKWCSKTTRTTEHPGTVLAILSFSHFVATLFCFSLYQIFQLYSLLTLWHLEGIYFCLECTFAVQKKDIRELRQVRSCAAPWRNPN